MLRNTLKFATLLLSVAALRAADPVVGGPFVVNVGTRQATLVWLTEEGKASLGKEPGKAEKTAPVLKANRVSFSGLQPGTRYHYDALGDGTVTGSFKTAPGAATTFDFIVYGDTRTRHDMHRRVIDAIVKRDAPDFVLHTGDLVQDGLDTAQWPVFFDIERALLRQTAFFPCLGNHERNNRQYYEFFDVQTPYYSFDWGTAHFTVLNSDMGNAAKTPEARDAFWAEQRRWVEQDLEKSQKADFRFVMAHHPPLTAVGSRQAGNPHMAALMPLFDKMKVAAVFAGHDHNYQHHSKNGVTYIVTGGGGAPLYPVDKPDPEVTKKVESTEHFVTVHIEGKKAFIHAIGLDGRVIDTIELGE